MGNSNGNLIDLWDMVYAERQMQGGFIWDFVDQGLAEFKDGKKYWAYGGITHQVVIMTLIFA